MNAYFHWNRTFILELPIRPNFIKFLFQSRFSRHFSATARLQWATTASTWYYIWFYFLKSKSATTFLGVFTRWAASTDTNEPPSLTMVPGSHPEVDLGPDFRRRQSSSSPHVRKGRTPLITTDSSFSCTPWCQQSLFGWSTQTFILKWLRNKIWLLQVQHNNMCRFSWGCDLQDTTALTWT